MMDFGACIKGFLGILVSVYVWCLIWETRNFCPILDAARGSAKETFRCSFMHDAFVRGTHSAYNPEPYTPNLFLPYCGLGAVEQEPGLSSCTSISNPP